MRGFDYLPARDAEEATAAMPQSPLHHPSERALPAKFIAGGTNLIDLMKENVMRPRRVVDVGRLPLSGIEAIEGGGLRLGATARNAATAKHPLVLERYPVLAAAILAGASPQIRNMATNGGNLLQRTRCHYFYDVAVPCNKREPGTGCPARDGLARQLAILGTSDHCIATHPSDMCVALAALEAVVRVRSPVGERDIAFADLHRLPGGEPDRDTTLACDELIMHIELPAQGFARHSAYLKLRDRASYAFALVSVAAALDLDEQGRIRTARIALGGVAHKPWRDPAAEALLAGREATAQAFGEAAQRLLQGARGHGAPGGPGDNRFKIELARRAIVRALEMARDGELTQTGELGAGHAQDIAP
ncbi:FAD binding domain-containing protein [Paracidovorax konjaci]|uniref:Xanthine dehydrogenase YagS FAD-binding subunit n=1 Tax=Paracidovorax konjaci TaxID=32040 RepID=A0A1I1SD00_9BURK|nr:xanthine dehydrogenase family protein subunit M [Paracidovorax konjaci]SFD44359.1 xanthine dehydrogenase YagS FAD-binding subunit [Paracidovorax konjaci]